MSWAGLAGIALAAGYMFYIGRLFRIGFSQVWKTQSEPARIGLSLAHIFTGHGEDGDYDLLWRTQVPALEILWRAGSRGVSTARMKEFYREFSRTYPELYDGSEFSDWLDALQSAGVVVRGEDTIAITEKGRFILERLDQRHALRLGLSV
jgi:hypothetical protein